MNKALVSYIDFHWDNHQGGSGTSVEGQCIIEFPADLKASNLPEYVTATLKIELQRTRPFLQGSVPTIKKIELLSIFK